MAELDQARINAAYDDSPFGHPRAMVKERARITAKQKRMEKAVASLTRYMVTYSKQPFYTDYSDETFISDVLYGLGIALSDEYRLAAGFECFKTRLREHLK